MQLFLRLYSCSQNKFPCLYRFSYYCNYSHANIIGLHLVAFWTLFTVYCVTNKLSKLILLWFQFVRSSPEGCTPSSASMTRSPWTRWPPSAGPSTPPSSHPATPSTQTCSLSSRCALHWRAPSWVSCLTTSGTSLSTSMTQTEVSPLSYLWNTKRNGRPRWVKELVLIWIVFAGFVAHKEQGMMEDGCPIWVLGVWIERLQYWCKGPDISGYMMNLELMCPSSERHRRIWGPKILYLLNSSPYFPNTVYLH